eukprot:2100567-Pyramimonas_sp.AAC.1
MPKHLSWDSIAANQCDCCALTILTVLEHQFWDFNTANQRECCFLTTAKRARTTLLGLQHSESTWLAVAF